LGQKGYAKTKPGKIFDQAESAEVRASKTTGKNKKLNLTFVKKTPTLTFERGGDQRGKRGSESQNALSSHQRGGKIKNNQALGQIKTATQRSFWRVKKRRAVRSGRKEREMVTSVRHL